MVADTVIQNLHIMHQNLHITHLHPVTMLLNPPIMHLSLLTMHLHLLTMHLHLAIIHLHHPMVTREVSPQALLHQIIQDLHLQRISIDMICYINNNIWKECILFMNLIFYC